MIQDIAHEVKLRNDIGDLFYRSKFIKDKEEILNLNSEVNEEYTDYFLQLIHNNTKQTYRNLI
jgi:coproporphyrinogen III oxidase